MDGNKDESNRCIDIAIREINLGNYDKATKFLRKAENLFPSTRGDELLRQVAKMSGGKQQNSDARTTSPVRQRKKDPPASAEAQPARTYTSDQLEMVGKIKKCKDYYEVLGVTKQSTDSEIKKAYKKLALQLHPDKNNAPGAVESFKAIGNAVAVLTDPRKRKEYDLFGIGSTSNGRNGSNHSTNYHSRNHHNFENAYDRGFESDISAEELFNMFFGGFPSQRRRAAQQQHQTENGGAASAPQPSLAFGLILLLILISMLSSFLTTDPLYSLSQTSKYPIKRETSNLIIPYYVRDSFADEYQGSMARLENSVEEEYIHIMKQNCYRERSYRESMMARARSFGSRAQLAQAQGLKTPSCDNLSKIGIHRYTLY